MSHTRNLFIVLTAMAFLALMVSGLMFSGCSSKATQEQLDQIKALNDQVSSLEKTIQGQEGQIARLEKDLAEKDAKLQQCEADKQVVKQRLATWQEPVPPAPPEQPKKGKK
jgi:septal ring factor EnvC (AmiA/AmiB activator)